MMGGRSRVLGALGGEAGFEDDDRPSGEAVLAEETVPARARRVPLVGDADWSGACAARAGRVDDTCAAETVPKQDRR